MSKIDEKYIIDNFETAIKKGYIKTYYQPIIRTLTGDICCVETLARWDDPVYGMIYPDVFINVLEKNDLICELDLFVIEKACKNYHDAVTEGILPASYSVNLSRIDFDNNELFEKVIAIFEKYNVPKSAINLEVTESVLLHNEERFNMLFSQFRKEGFEIWVDDFGNGYASLNVLKDYDFNLLKIDMEFLKKMSERSRKIIASVINMSKTLGMHTLVEGVETQEQVTFLREIGCEMMQGYYFSRPVNENDFFMMLKDGKKSVETSGKKQYISAVGMINALSADPLNEYYKCVLNNGSLEMTSHSRYPLALLEVFDGRFKFIYYNEAYKYQLLLLGFSGVDDAERKINDRNRQFYEGTIKQMNNSLQMDRIIKKNYVLNNKYYSLTMMAVAQNEQNKVFALSVNVFCNDGIEDRYEEIDKYNRALFYNFELVNIINPVKNTSRQIYSNMPFDATYGYMKLDEGIKKFAENELFHRDSSRYIEFMDMGTIKERIMEDSCPFIQQPFRVRISEDGYEWHLIRITEVPTQDNDSYMFTIQHLSREDIAIIEDYYRD